jgi:hypothetical protein
MKIEFLADGDPDCPLIRLSDYKAGELEQLRTVCFELADRRRNDFAFHDQPWIESVGDCKFVWRGGRQDVGVRLPAVGMPFVLEFSDEGWREVADKLAPFIDGSDGFNWLANEGDVKVLISRYGAW